MKGFWSSIIAVFTLLITTTTLQAQLPAPTSLVSDTNANGYVVLTWSTVPAATGYNIYRSGVLIKSFTSGAASSYVDVNAIAGQISKYCVSAVSGGTESRFSNCIIDSTLYLGALVASNDVDDAKIDISWSLTGSCLLTPMNDDLYLEVTNTTTGEEIHNEIIKNSSLDSFLYYTSLQLNNQNYLLLDSNYTGIATPVQFNNLGRSVDIYGNYAVIGAPGADNDTGAVFIYKKTPGGWVQEAKLRATSPIVTDTFGFDVAMHGNRIVVGAPGGPGQAGRAYIFEKSAGVWSQTYIATGTPSDPNGGFGRSVTVDSFTVLVGAPTMYSGQGAMFYYHQYLGNWYRLARLISPAASANQQFGFSLEQYNNFLVVGGPGDNLNRGKAFIYEHVGFTWYYRATITPPGLLAGERFGSSVAMYLNRAVVGSPGYNGNRGRVSIFDRSGAANNWPYDDNLWPGNVQVGDRFGSGVSVFGNWIASASPNTHGGNGSVYMWNKPAGSWQQGQEIVRPAGLASDLFGAAIAIDADDLLVGAPYENTGQGKVYTYLRTGSSWSPNGTLGDIMGQSQTVEFWVNRQGVQGGTGPLLVDDNVGLHIKSAGTDQLNYISGGGTPVYFNYTLPVGKWTHIALVVDSANTKTRLYVNGTLVDEKGIYAPVGIERFGFTNLNAVPQSINALVKDIRYWNVIRDSAQILANYNSILTGGEAGLVGYWKLDEGMGNNMADAAGNYTPARFKPSPPVTWFNDSILVPVTGNSFQYVGANQTMQYQLKAYAIGFGNQVCNTLTDTGTTLPYIQPTIVVDTTHPDSINFTWTNLSKAVSFYRVFRGNTLLGILDSTAESYSDVYTYNNPNSLQNGEQYRYCFVPFSTRFLTNNQATVYDSLCLEGATRALNFTATDNAFPNKVKLTWRNIGGYSDALEITKDGQFFAQLDSNVTMYVDEDPTPGKRHRYELRVMNNGALIVADADTGSVNSVGVIAGRVVTQLRDYALDGLSVTITAIIQGDTIIRDQTTGLTGDFRFDQVYFNESATYTVSVDSPADFNILNPSIPVSLKPMDFIRDNVLFRGDKVITATGTQPLSLTNFVAANQPGEDKVLLTWNYSSSDTTWFKLYRNNQLISILCDTNTSVVNSYMDLKGTPGSTLTYKVVAYVYDQDTVVTESSGQDTAALEDIAPVALLTATANPMVGTVSLNWTHTSTNILGFKLYRDGILLATIDKDSTYSFEDLSGVPGTSYTYSIKVYADRSGVIYHSAPTNATPTPIIYPALPAPLNVTAVAQSGDETVLVSWAYPQAGNTNFFGFVVRRIDQVTMDTVRIVFIHQNCIDGTAGLNNLYSFVDRRGIPGRNYRYEVLAMKQAPEYYSAPVGAMAMFPAIQMVNTFNASDNAFHSWIALGWTDACPNHDGYLIQRNGSDLVWLPKQAMGHIDGLNSRPSVQSFNYTIYPYRMVDGTRYVGTAGKTDAGSTIVTPIVTTPAPAIVPLNVQASDNYSGHIQVSWTYPPYALSKFFLYRDGVLQDSFENDIRFWYDTSAVEGITYVYSLQARFMGVWSGFASDPGTLRPKMQVEGVAQTNTGFGIPDALIQVSIGGQVLYQTYTDSTGFYRIDGMTKPLGAVATVTASAANANFINPNRTYTVIDTINRYTVNFTDTTYKKVIPSQSTIAQITNFIATIDPLTNKVNLSWNASSSNFTGFKLYRELGEIADVTFDQPKFFLDEIAAPGFRYTYRVQAYWVLPTGTQNSVEAFVEVDVPQLAPVVALQAIPDHQEDVVTLYWSHTTDNHTYYEIKRNGTVLGAVLTGERLSFTDTSGLPGRNYKYLVTCYELGPAGSFTSEPRQVDVKFPNVAPVELLTLQAVPSDNHVKISWQHTSKFYHFATVYRYDESDTIPEPIDTIFKNEPLKLSVDYWGVPLDTNWYQVVVSVEKDGQFYESDPVEDFITFPVVATPSTPTATPGLDQVTISGVYNPADGYTGFQFYRNDSLREQKTGLSSSYNFVDADGQPGALYKYEVRAFKEMDLTHYSAFATVNENFPLLSPPTACNASDSLYFNHIEVTWLYPTAANTGFIIFRDGVALDTIGSTNTANPSKSGSGLRRYLDILNEENLPPDYTYEIQAYQIRGGVWYLSAKSNADDGSALIQNFSTVTRVPGTGGEQLGRTVSVSKEVAVAGTQSGVRRAKTFTLQATSTFDQEDVLTPDPSSGTNSAFGWDVDALDNRLLVSAPWAWDPSGQLGYRSGEIYVYNVGNSGTASLDTILRNFNWMERKFGADYRVQETKTATVTESNDWINITGYNQVADQLGPANNGIGVGGGDNDMSEGLRFISSNPTQNSTINRITIYPQDTGSVTIRVRGWSWFFFTYVEDYNWSASFNVEPPTAYAPVELTINAPVTAGSEYYTIDASGTLPFPFPGIQRLYANNNGGSYPYSDSHGILSITQPEGSGGNSYNYFYDWKVTVPGDTLGTREQDSSVYRRTLTSKPFNVSVSETNYGSDIQLDSVKISLQKSSAQDVWLENVSLVHVASGKTIRLFSTNSNPAGCVQDDIQASFQNPGGGGTLQANAGCGATVTGNFTAINPLTGFNPEVPSGAYRIRSTVVINDPNVAPSFPSDPSYVDNISASVTVDVVGLYFRSLPGGIYTDFITTNAEMGRSIASNNNTIVGGAPVYDGSKGEVTAFRRAGGVWSHQDTLFAPPGSEGNCSYYQINISFPGWADETSWRLLGDDNSVVGQGGPYGYGGNVSVTVNSNKSPHKFQIETQGFFNDNTASYNIQGNSGQLLSSSVGAGHAPWREHGGITSGCTGGIFGYAVAMSSSQLLVGVPNGDDGDGNGRKGKVLFYNSGSGSNWKVAQTLSINNPGPSDDQFGYSVSVSQNVLAVGAKGDDWDDDASKYDAGSVSLYQYDPGASEFKFLTKLFNPDGPKKTFEFFGYDVAISGNLLAVGAPNVDSTGVDEAGAVYLYEKDELDNWVFKKRYFAPNGSPYSHFGTSVSLAGNTLMVGAPNQGSNNGEVYFFYIRDQIDTVIASDGTEINKTRIEWIYEGVRGNLSNFHIYRDGSLIDAADPNKSFVFDYDAIPGRRYVYQVRPVSLDGVEGVPKGDIGWRPENGILDGQVITQQGAIGVRDVNIEAWANVNGEIFRYNAVTNGLGDYKIKNMYYDDSTRYYVRAYKTGHEFQPDTQSIEFNLQQNERALNPFYDLTAYVVYGVAKYQDTDCPIDSVEVRQIKVTANSRTTERVNTDAEGNYSFNIQPLDPDIIRYEYEIDSLKVSIGTSQTDTIYHYFGPGPDTLDNLLALGRATELDDFEDTTKYTVDIYVETVCGPIDDPNPHKWVVQIKSKDGCYDRQVVTTVTGFKRLYLPPKDYSFRVVSVTGPNPTTLTAIEYLKVRPRRLDLKTYHKDLKGEKKDSTLNLNFIFHVTPKITIPNLTGFLCADPNLPVVIEQGKDYTYNVAVNERFGGTDCPVTEGYVVVRNDAAKNPVARLDFDPITQSFPAYNFVAGEPNPIAPFVKYMFVEYHTESDGFLGELPVAFIVEGISQIPGNDIFVNLDSNGNQLLLPLFVLRDPPGDGSSSTIDSGTTVEANLKVSEKHEFIGGLNLELQFTIFDVGLKVNVEQQNGGGFGNETEYKVTMETTKSFSTSSTSAVDNATNTDWLTGNSADVLVGAGVALGYGIGREIRVTDTCSVLSSKVITTGAEIKTTWIYTIDQINNLVREYNANIENTRNGLYRIVGLDQDETIDFLTVRRDNWLKMLEYHAIQTLPHYALCDPTNFTDIPEPWKSAAEQWRKKGFCERIGAYSTKNGKEIYTLFPDSTWTWDTDLLNRYNAVKQQVRDIEDYLTYTGAMTYSESRLNNVTVDQAYAAAFGPDAKNITFSGGTSYTESRSISKSKGVSHTQFWNNDTKISLGPATDLEATIYLGAWAGFGAGVVTMTDKLKPVKFKFSLQGFFQYKFEYNEVTGVSQGTSQKVSYTLADDDPGDQFSVTIVNGVNATHTPFFALTGGRSSCPNEPGAINRDIPQIEVLDPFGNTVNKTQQNKDPEKTVYFPLQLSNLNPFGEGRWYELYVVENTNPNGAAITVNSKTLSTSAVEKFFIPADGSVYATLGIKKGPFFYDYEGIQIGLYPICDPYIVDAVELNISFRHPCSDVSIIRPGNGWVINDDTSDIGIFLADYDPFNPELKRIQVMYRRLNQVVTPTTWDTIASITADSLANFYTRNKPTFYYPTFPFSWDLSQYPDLEDGEYELVALANCGAGGLIQSNRVRGTINRSRFTVLGYPQPSDGLLSKGEEISVSFNKQIDCPKSTNTAAYYFHADSPNGPLVSVQMGCIGNKMVFVIDSILQYEGRMIYASLDSVYDINGNRQYEPVLWSFEVSNNPVYWYPREIEVTVERGTQKEATAYLKNTGVGTEPYSLNNNSAWLTPLVLAGVVPPAGEPVAMRFDARTLAVGTYTDTITADITGYTEEKLPVTMHVIKPVPNWVVDPANYQHNVSVIAIPDIDGVESTDTNDVVTAWIDGELRGVGKVRRSGASYYAAYVSVYGDAEDTTKPVDFRVWDATAGAEFQGHPDIDVFFTSVGTVYGSTPDPINIEVDTDVDSLRYIPLKKGWNWLSINSILTDNMGNIDMSIENVLKSLSLDNGDVIMSQTSSAEYLDTLGTTGWNTIMGLSEIDSTGGYLLHLRHADTLRLSGRATFNGTITMFPGWNLIGYTPQGPLPIDSAFVVVVPLFDEGDVFKSQTEFSVFTETDSTWQGSLTTLSPYNAYKVKSGVVRNVNYRSDNHNDWLVEPAAFEQMMRVVATIKINGFEFRDNLSKVAAFVDGECRGVGTLQYIEELNRYRAQVIIYSNDPGEEVTFKFWDGLEDTVYNAVQTLIYDQDALVGNLVSAYVVSPNFLSNGTDIGQVQMQSTFEVFPNPFRHELMLSIDEPLGGDYTITMYNTLGQMVLNDQVTTVKGPNRIYLEPGSALSSGMYQITIRKDDEIIETLKVIRQ